MAFFRKSSTQADELARHHRSADYDLDAAVRGVLDELGLPLHRARQGRTKGWIAELGDAYVLLRPMAKEAVVGAMMPVGEYTDRPDLLEFLRRNLEHHLAYYADGIEPTEIAARIRLSMDPFDREALIQGVQALAEILEDRTESALVQRLREARGARGGEAAEETMRASAVTSFEQSLAEIGLTAVPGADADMYKVETTRGPIDAILHASGETWMLMHDLAYSYGVEDETILRWLLELSGGRGARLGLAQLPAGDALFAVTVLPARNLNASGLAWSLEQVLRLSDGYDQVRQ
jgi:hypothetical protein